MELKKDPLSFQIFKILAIQTEKEKGKSIKQKYNMYTIITIMQLHIYHLNKSF